LAHWQVQQPTAQKPVHFLDKGLGFPSMLIVSSNAEHCRLQESRHGTRNSWWLSRHGMRLWGLASTSGTQTQIRVQTCRYQQYGGTTAIAKTLTKTETSRKDLRLVRGPLDGVPGPRPGSDSYEVRSTGCLDRTPAPTRTRSARRGASTAPRLRLVRGPLDGVPRPHPGSDSYEARSTGHLDHAPAPRRPFFTYPGQKP
jgi:hypothetical protein